MKALLALLVLLTAWPCEAQVRRRAFGPKKSSGSGITLPSGIAHRWIATNLFDPVTNWFDIITGTYAFTNSTAFPNFTNGLGVHFNGAQQLRGTNEPYTTNCAFVVVFKPQQVAATRAVLGASGDGNLSFGHSGGAFFDEVAAGYGTPENNKIYDVFYPLHSANKGVFGANTGPYTNGVWTAHAENTTFFSQCTSLGKGGGTFLLGTIYEFIVWTNFSGWTASSLDDIHKYCTNRWGFSP